MRIDEYRHVRYGAELIGVQAGTLLPPVLSPKEWIFSLSRNATEIEKERLSQRGSQ